MSGLPYLKHWRPSDEQMATLPQVRMTSDCEWLPLKYNDFDTTEERLRMIPTTPIDFTDNFYDLQGNVNTNVDNTFIGNSDDPLSGFLWYEPHQYPDELDLTEDVDIFFEEFHTPSEGSPTSHLFVDSALNTSYLDDLRIPRPTEPEYWDSFFDASTCRLIYRGSLDRCDEYNISASDILPRPTVPSDIDYESKRKYFSYFPVDVIRATFHHTSHNLKLPPSTHM